MKIETKFDVGQEVFGIQRKRAGSVVVSFIIETIMVHVMRSGLSFPEYHGYRIMAWEKNCFLTRADAEAEIERRKA